MSNRLKGYLLGTALSLAGVALWVLLGVVVEIIAGIAGALMGILFIIGYKKFNPEKEGKLLYVVAAAVIIVEIALAEVITVAILAGKYEVSFGAVLGEAEIQRAMLIDILIGVVLSAVAFGFYIVNENNKRKNAAKNPRPDLGKGETAAEIPAETAGEANVTAAETAAAVDGTNEPKPDTDAKQ